jgi:MerR family transcriptional regulator, light-induced transcriptional regulator
MSEYSIKDLEKLSGIKAHTLRIWEQRFNLMQPKRSDSNIRMYSDVDLKLALNISMLRDHGYKISEIAEMPAHMIGNKVLSLTEKSNLMADKIQALTLFMIDLDTKGFQNVLTENIDNVGFEQTIINLIYPFLVKVGTLWQTGSVGPAQEHFFTELIRQKLYVAIESIKREYSAEAKTFVVFNPENEYHDISPLFAHYILKNRGHKVHYFGQSLPFADLEFVVNKVKPQAIFTAFTNSYRFADLQAYINKMAVRFQHVDIMITGSQVIGQGLDLPENVRILTQIQDLINIAD